MVACYLPAFTVRSILVGSALGTVIALGVGVYLLLRWLYDRRIPSLFVLREELLALRAMVRLHRPAAQARRAMLAEARRHWKLQ